MDIKEKLLNSMDGIGVVPLSENELKAKIDTTISNTFMWMGVTLLAAFGTAYYLYFNHIVLTPAIFWGSTIGGFVLVLAISFGWQKLNYTLLAALLVVFGLLEGVGLTGIFYKYQLGSIYNIFLTTAIMFFGLAFAGSKLNIDVTKFGSILMFGLIALIIGFVINIFWANSEFNIWLNAIGVTIFAGFVIYDMAMLKQMALLNDKRVEILMGLALFLDFINIFIMLLQLFGKSND